MERGWLHLKNVGNKLEEDCTGHNYQYEGE